MPLIRNIKEITFLALTFASTACHAPKKKSDPVWSELPGATSLSSLKETAFVITLENPITKDKNIIYAPAFLFAWDKIKEELQSPVVTNDSNSTDFILLNRSIAHKNALTDQEYSVTAELKDGVIMAKAFFNKTLPFETKLEALRKPIHFDTTDVAGFGMYYYSQEAIRMAKILYYKDDENFVLQLTPKDKQHEIILVKGITNYETLTEALQQYDSLVAKGKEEAKNAKLSWKYQIIAGDIFAIPSIRFNIETDYPNLVGQQFSTKNNEPFSITVAYQRTGLILNENGAVVESEAAVGAAVDSGSAEPIIIPKKMVFDKPFLIIVKRVDRHNPYFVMKVANAELLIRK